MPLVLQATGPVRRAKMSATIPGWAEYGGYTPTIYAAPADVGNGSGSSEANAMDFATALSTATAGDIVGMIPGVYEGPVTATRFVPSFMPANSGTEENPIRIVAKYRAAENFGETALYSELRNAGDNIGTVPNPDSNPVIGAVQRAYIIIDGIYAKMSTAFPRASNGVICLSGGTSGLGCVITKIVIDADVTVAGDYNGNAIFAENAGYFTISDCIFNGTSSEDPNNASIETYGCGYFTIENNTFYAEQGHGIYIKGTNALGTWVDNTKGTIRYNKTENGGIAIGCASGLDIHNNLYVGDGRTYFYPRVSGGGYEGVRFYNNTIVNTDTSLGTRGAIRLENPNDSGYPGGGNGWHDNIMVTATTTPLLTGGLFDEAQISYFDLIDDNVYYASGATGQWLLDAGSYSGLTNWQSALATIGAVSAAQEASSLLADPLFVGSGDYRLQVTSPALAGVDGRAATAGCYVTGSEQIGARV